MRHKTFLAGTAALALSLASGCATASGDVAGESGDSAASARSFSQSTTTPSSALPVDVQLMDDAVRNQHANAFAVIPEKVWAKKVQDVADAFPSAAKDERAMLLAGLAGLLDTHTQFFGPPELMYDVWFYRFADGMYVVSARDRSLIGARLVSIGQTTAKEVEKQMQPLIPSDNASAELNAAYLTAYVDHLHGLGIVTDPARPRFTFALPNGRQRTVDVSSSTTFASDLGILGSTAGTFTEALRHRGDGIWWRTDRASRSFLLSVSDYLDPTEAIASMQKALDSGLADRVVLDVRYLRGGDWTPLLSLVDALRSDVRVNRQGHLTVLIGRENESAATVLVQKLDTTTKATLIGEPTPARADPFTCPCEDLDLPTTGYVFSVPQSQLGNGDPRRAVTPDERMNIRSTDFFAGRDLTLEEALKR